MIIIIGGIIVASVLVFIIILMIRYKVYSGQDEHKKAKVSNVYSQTNGGQPHAAGPLPCSASKPEEWGADPSAAGRVRRDCSILTLGKEGDKGGRGHPPEAGPEEAPSPHRRRRWSRTNVDLHNSTSGPEASRAEEQGECMGLRATSLEDLMDLPNTRFPADAVGGREEERQLAPCWRPQRTPPGHPSDLLAFDCDGSGAGLAPACSYWMWVHWGGLRRGCREGPRREGRRGWGHRL
ncbi:UNVERIFIED_CONTAM: hypothetical protein K2H54_032184 [Gekko kuhli]